MTRILALLLSTFVSLGLAAPKAQAAGLPVIISAAVDYTHNTVTITGQNFGTKTLAFTTEADKFRNYASAWRDRWNSVMELFMAGGNYAVSQVPFPAGFPQAAQAEIAAAR